MKHKQRQVGQAGLVVMLIMVVLLTLGISIASRSTSGVTQSTQEQESSRVFDAAEAGIEQALSRVLTTTQNSVEVNDLTANYTVAELTELDARIDEGNVAAVDTTGYGGTVAIEWSKVSDCVTQDPASIEVSIFNSTNNTVRREAYAGCTHSGDWFSASLGGTAPYAYKANVVVGGQEDLVRIRPVYNDTHLHVTGGADFPPQNHRIVSEASNISSGEIRAVEVNRSLPTAPAIFDYVLFSGTGLSK